VQRKTNWPGGQEEKKMRPEQKLGVVSVFFAVLSLVLFGSTGCERGPGNSTWSIKLEGARTEIIYQDYFEQAIADCHGKKYTDEQGNVWEGMPLWFLAGRIDDGRKHGKNGYNESLADQGYEIEVISANRSVKFNSRETKLNDNIIVACYMGGARLRDETAPLALVGSGVDEAHRLDRITSIKLIFAPAQ
jgi:hypothetical protein